MRQFSEQIALFIFICFYLCCNLAMMPTVFGINSVDNVYQTRVIRAKKSICYIFTEQFCGSRLVELSFTGVVDGELAQVVLADRYHRCVRVHQLSLLD